MQEYTLAAFTDNPITIISPPSSPTTMGSGASHQQRVPSSVRRKERPPTVATSPAKQPMPQLEELEKRFEQAIASMDLPPDKVKLLRKYDLEKKWEIVCDQERVQAKDPPAYYLNKLKTYLDPKASRSSRKRKSVGRSTSTQVLRDLEISLRTNHIEWVREFLNEENQGLDVLVDYLSFRLLMMRHEVKGLLESEESNLPPNGTISTQSSGNPPSPQFRRMPSLKRASRHVAKLKMGEAKDDIHVCILCLRAIMNNKYGFNMVIQHSEAIACIALSLNHKSLRTKALVLELLAAICLVKGGHSIILNAFDRFAELTGEKRRFETLMSYFMHYEIFHVEFMVACMQFVNIVVHSVEDMNFRVHLQYEFTNLGLDDYLEKIRHTESEELKVQISAYLDNVFDVAALMEDSETKTAALERVAQLEDEIAHTHERLVASENELLNKQTELQEEIYALRTEKEMLDAEKRALEGEIAALRSTVAHRDEEYRHQQSRIKELENITNSLPRTGLPSSSSIPPPPPMAVNAPAPPPPPLPSAAVAPGPPPPPPPPAPPMECKAPPPPGPPPAPGPPPPPGLLAAPSDAMTIKRRIQTRFKLPTLNWVALKPNQVRGTIFNELDDEALFAVIDFQEFEEQFKIGIGPALTASDSETDGLSTMGSKRFKKPETTSLLENNRLRNIAICRRRLEMPVEQVIRAVNALDLKTLGVENVEVLQRMIPSDQETKAYREYLTSKRPLEMLSEEDKFMYALSRTERLSTKLSVMAYMANFFDNIHLVQPQSQAVLSASRSLTASKKLRRLLEVILAFGNYLNSGKRGPAYGFKLQSLEALLDTKSADRKMSLLHYVVETISQKFPEVSSFEAELRFIEKAAAVSMENVMTDVQELEKGMELTKKELELRKDFRDEKQSLVLKDFLQNAEEKLRKVKAEAKTSQEAFHHCVEYFGDSPRQTDSNAFFAQLARFVKLYKQAEAENDQRRRLQAAAEAAASKPQEDGRENGFKGNPKKQQELVVGELLSRTRQVQEKKLLPADQVYNGALEDILLGLKSEPYRRADAVRRSQRRRHASNRLSKGLDDLDL